SHFNNPIKAGISLEGAQLGRLSHTSIGMLRGEIRCTIPDTYDWTRFGQASAILTVNELINHINEIEIPQRPRSRIVLGSIRAGSSFTTAKRATLRFEIRSESLDIVKSLKDRLEEIIKQVSSQSADSIELEIFAERKPGGTDFTHPLVRNAHKILEALNVESKPGPSTSALSTFIDREIPAITLGISKAANLRNENASIETEPMFTGIAQILAILQAIDGGFCEEDR
ncbi:MAG TPA: peptidase dimerization domain-containing protein, partial [Balneolaceae bacterium]|nr:peptidase dimerization domain-containing protein [Balneolaceae bacterium]